MQQTENLAPHVQEIARALQDKLDKGAIEDELRRYLDYGVPLAQAKRDIVRMHGGSLQAGPKKIDSLQPEDRGVDLVAKILTVNPRTVTVKGQPKEITYGFLADETGKASYTAWKDLKLERGAVYRIKNAYVKKGFREGVDVQMGDYTSAERQSADLAVKDEFGGPTPGGEFAGRITAERKVRELTQNDRSVSLRARVLALHEKTVSTTNGQRTIVEGELADETGRVPFSVWEPDRLPAAFREDAVVHVKNAYVKAFRGQPQVSIGQYATIEVMPEGALPSAEQLRAPAKRNLAELAASGGGNGVRVDGVVLEVKKGSGLIFRCSVEGCNRVLQNRQCALHPQRQEGVPDLRVKAILDDGYGAATFFADRASTERLLGKTLAQCQQQAKDAMTVDVVQEDLDRVLTGKRVAVFGRAMSGEFGLQLMADDIEFAPERHDLQPEVEALLARIAEHAPEVA
jgi:replication factor A1